MIALLLDMNLSPRCIPFLQSHHVQAVHCSSIGRPNATDEEILNYARREKLILFTADLDFTAILASSNAARPSVVQLRTGDLSPEMFGLSIVSGLQRYAVELDAGALMTMEPERNRIRLLPLFSEQ